MQILQLEEGTRHCSLWAAKLHHTRPVVEYRAWWNVSSLLWDRDLGHSVIAAQRELDRAHGAKAAQGVLDLAHGATLAMQKLDIAHGVNSTAGELDLACAVVLAVGQFGSSPISLLSQTCPPHRLVFDILVFLV